MANLAPLPSATELLARQPQDHVVRSYGPPGRSLWTQVYTSGDMAVLFEGSKDALAALVSVVTPGTVSLQAERINPLNLPYVNKFLVGHRREVKKNWRTGLYETRHLTAGASRKARRAAARAAAATAHTTSLIVDEAVTAKPITYQPKAVEPKMARGATITVTSDEHSLLGSIPGIEFPAKQPLKGAGRGWSDVGGIILPNDQLEELQDAWSAAQAGEVAATLITGPAGTAKTMVVRGFAASIGAPYLKVDAGSVRTVDDWSGMLRQDPATKTWDHRWSPFARALRAGIPMVLHVDELTRTDTPAALNAFMGLLDETGTMLVPDANDVLRMPKGILLVATANIGPEFVGTLPLDGAVRQRFPYGFRMAPPPKAAEVKLLMRRTGVTEGVATALVAMAIDQRQHRDDAQLYPSGAIISTRVLIAAARKIAAGRDPRKAIQRTLSIQFDEGDDAALSVLIDSQFPKGVDVNDLPKADDTTIVTERHYFVAPPSGVVGCTWTFSNGSRCAAFPDHQVHLK